MFSQDILDKLKQHFPDVSLKFKDQSFLMKFLGTILFFNKDFMTNYLTTIGNTIYFPSENYISTKPNSALIYLLHELIHVSDSKKISRFLFGLLYLSPLSLIPLALLLFLLSWKLAIPAVLLCAAPIPSYFRMLFEKRAYLATLYVEYKLNQKRKFNINLDEQKENCIKNFTTSKYYFMWPFKNSLEQEFDNALVKIKNGERPYDNPAFDILDDIISVV